MICCVIKRIDQGKKTVLARPYEGKCRPAVKTGQKVSEADIIAHCELSAGQRLLRIAHVLGVSGRQVEKYLTRKVGDRIYEGEIIARRGGFLGVGRKEIKSPIDGMIAEIDPRGDLIVKFLPKPVRLLAGAAGEVTEISESAISISTVATKIHGFVSVGKLREGIVEVVAGPKEFIIPTTIKVDAAGKILVGGALLEKSALEKAVTVGVAGIITGGMNYREFASLVGGGDVGTTVTITESFGVAPIGGDIWEYLNKKVGHLGFISGDENHFVLPEHSVTGKEVAETAAGWRELRVGDKVRYLRKESSDLIGQVKELPSEQMLNSGILAEVAKVSFKGGEEIMLPAANLEIVE